MSPTMTQQPRAGLGGLPREMFSGIARDLDRRDIRALSYVSKPVRALAEQHLYALVRVRDKKDFASLSRALLSNPHLSDLARSYWVGKEAPWWSLDLVQSLRSLRSLTVRPYTFAQGHAAQMAEKIAARGFIQPSLKQFSMEFFYSDVNDVPRDVVDDLLCAVMSAPSLETVTATYTWDLGNFYPEDEYYVLPYPLARPLPIFGGTRCTDLRELCLHWDLLSLNWLSALLRLPRSLEALHLRFNQRRSLFHEHGVAMPLNSALRPIAHSLRTLTIVPIKDHAELSQVGECWMDDLHLTWGQGGLREFDSLEYLGVPAGSWTMVLHSPVLLEGGRLALPDSLKTLHISSARLVYETSNGWNVLSEDGIEVSKLRYTDSIVNGTPRLGHIQVMPSKRLDLDYLSRHLPPVHLPLNMKPIVDAGTRILVELPGGGSVELKTCLDK